MGGMNVSLANNDQAWWDHTWHSFSDRWCSEMSFCKIPFRPAAIASLFPPHIILPFTYNFCVDAWFVKFFRNMVEAGSKLNYRSFNLMSIRLLHWPGQESKPWWRCVPQVRSIWDEQWWEAYSQLCT